MSNIMDIQVLISIIDDKPTVLLKDSQKEFQALKIFVEDSINYIMVEDEEGDLFRYTDKDLEIKPLTINKSQKDLNNKSIDFIR